MTVAWVSPEAELAVEARHAVTCADGRSWGPWMCAVGCRVIG